MNLSFPDTVNNILFIIKPVGYSDKTCFITIFYHLFRKQTNCVNTIFSYPYVVLLVYNYVIKMPDNYHCVYLGYSLLLLVSKVSRCDVMKYCYHGSIVRL